VTNINDNKTIFLLVGESGSGKSTLAEYMCDMFNMTQIQSYTTRHMRYEGEKGHIFVDPENFPKNGLVAFTIFNKHRYCATVTQVEENDVYVIDLAGIEYFREHYHGNKNICIIYVNTNERERNIRMLAREDSCDDAYSRIVNDRIAFKAVRVFADIIVDNNGSCKYYMIRSLADQYYKKYGKHIANRMTEDFLGLKYTETDNPYENAREYISEDNTDNEVQI